MEGISFAQLYDLYKRNTVGFFREAPVLPKCCVTKTDIFGDIDTRYLESSSNRRPHNFEYWIQYLIDTGDTDKLVCYEIYQKQYAKEYEKVSRRLYLTSENKHIAYNKLNIPKTYWGWSLDMLLADGKYAQQKEMRETAEAYIAGNYKSTLLLASRQVGTGKSLIAACIALQYWLDNGIQGRYKQFERDWSVLNSPVLYLNEAELYFLTQATFSNSSPHTEYQIFKHLTEMPFLVLDDIYFGGDKEFTKTRIARLVHMRVVENNMPMVLTSNYTIQDLTAIDKRVMSRLYSGKYYSASPQEKLIDLRKE